MTIRSKGLGLAAVLAAALAGGAHAQMLSDSPAVEAPSGVVEQELPQPPETLSDFVADLNGDGIAVPMDSIPADAEIATLALSALGDDGSNSGSAMALENALARAQTQLDMLQTRIDGDKAISGMLEREGIGSDSVLGVYKSVSAGYTVLIDDRA